MKIKKLILLLSGLLIIIFFSISFYSLEADFIICTVNDTPITYIQFMRELNRYKIALQSQGQKIPDNVKEVVLNNLIEINLILQEAKRQNIQVNDDEVKLNIESIKKRYGMSDEQFIEQLKMEGFSYNEFFNNYKNQMIRYRFLSTYIKKLVKDPTENEIEKFYNENKEKFKGSKRFDTIVFYSDLDKDAKLFDKLNAKKILIKFHDEVTIDNFKDLLKKFNETNKIKIKDYNKIIYPEIEDKDFVKVLETNLNDNKSSVFFYNSDYYFFLIKNEKEIDYIPLEAIREKIVSYLEQTKMEKEFKKWIDEQKSKALIKWYRKDIIYGNNSN